MTKIGAGELYDAAVRARREGDLVKAGALYSRFVQVNPRLPAAWDQLGQILSELGNFRDAEECWTGIIRFMPDYAYLGQVHAQLCRTLAIQSREEAITHGRKAVEIAPRFELGWLNLGTALEKKGEFEEAVHCFEQAAALGGSQPQVALHGLKRWICAWEGLEPLERDLLQPSREWRPDMLLEYFGFLPTGGPAQRQTAERAIGKTSVPPICPVGKPPMVKDRKIRLGFLSYDFREHATSYLLASTFENFDRDRFELHAYATGPSGDSEYARRIRAAVDGFYDVQQAIDTEILAHMSKCGIDILFDVNGYTTGNRRTILARRPAPIQINYLAWPGTMGADFIDYMIADPIAAPDQSLFTEKLIYLDCYQPTDDGRADPKPPRRSELGLPEDALILCSMNATKKITPSIMALWCEVLRENPHAILWQLESSPAAARNLTDFARQQGVAEQFVLAPPLPYRDHLDRIGVADLAVDTFPYGGHTTTSDVLWAGVPVVTLTGESFVSRVAASLLNAAGMPQLATTTPGEYKALISSLCRDRARLETLKAQLRATRRSCDLFNNKRYTKALETKLMELVS